MATRTFDVRFVSSNEHKIREATDILGAIGVRVVPISVKIEELQTPDTRKLIRDKVLKAFHASVQCPTQQTPSCGTHSRRR